MALRCLIVDDNSAFVAAARTLLDGRELTVVGDAATPAETVERADQLAPDVILLDINLGGESGLELAHELARRADGRGPQIVLISGYAKGDFADLVEESPAVGFIGKSELSATSILELVRGEPQDGA